jgi:glycosyltransferase involved in cell wall biosynthesis
VILLTQRPGVKALARSVAAFNRRFTFRVAPTRYPVLRFYQPARLGAGRNVQCADPISAVRILWVKAGKLLPVDTGGKVRSYNILKELARNHNVSLLSYYHGPRDAEYESAISRELPGTRSICTARPNSKAAESGYYLCRLFGRAPFSVSKFAHPEVQRMVWASLDGEQFDVAVCDFLAPSLNFRDRFAIPVVLFQHNVETTLWQRMESTEKNPVKRLVYRIEAAKMKRYESAALCWFHHVIAVSDYDKQRMLAMDPRCPISVVPTGVDTKKLATPGTAEHGPPKIVFTGSMDWEPNIDGVDYFCREILPQVQREFPTVLFQIVGRNPSAKVRRLTSTSIEVTGTVASVDEYLRGARLVVVPLRIGGGTRLKIFEAMARGKAVISTTVGAEGLDVQDGRDLILADDPADFAEAICRLLHNSAVRRKFEQAAVACIGQHDWSRIAERFEDVLQRTVGAARQRVKS